MRIGVVATSSAVPMIELELGVEHLRARGFEVSVHPQCAQQHFTFAGTDDVRAEALWEYARNDRFEAIWCARGGYGAQRLLPRLRQLTQLHGPPAHKLLVGYSDITVLHEFVRQHWNWATLHAPMPAAPNFASLHPQEWSAIEQLVRRQRPHLAWEQQPLTCLTTPPAGPLRAPLVGGNLTLWNCLSGTPDQPRPGRSILFFEDISEAWYRIDRTIIQLEQAGAFDDVTAIVCGDFTNCRDEAHQVLAARPDPASPQGPTKKPLRRFYENHEAMREIFGGLSRRRNLPVFTGLPVGHGPGFHPLPLGAVHEVSPQGNLRLLEWSWIKSETPGGQAPQSS